jgi:multidrug efflux pump subunit AcrA (membrane-fusion protein)
MKLPLMSILGVCLMALINGCSQPRETSPVPRSVKVVVPETIEAVTTRQFNGVLQERDRSDLAFRVGGPLERIFVNEGDYVKSGETLALIDSRDYEINLRVAEAKYKQAKAK